MFANQLAGANGPRAEQIRKVLRVNSRDLDLGVITTAQFAERVRNRAGLSESTTELRQICLGSSLVPIPENIRTLERLRKTRNLRILAVTNVGREVADALERKVRLSRLFDDFVRSCELGILKPDPRFYQESVKRSGTPIGGCLYLDDSLRFVRAARALGIRAEWIRTPNSLPRRLSSYFD